MGAKYHYFNSCVDHAQHEVESLNTMIDKEIDVTLSTMKKHCIELAAWAEGIGYESDKRKGLTLANDWSVSYHRSTYNGRRCYFVRWSAIEYIWVQ